MVVNGGAVFDILYIINYDRNFCVSKKFTCTKGANFTRLIKRTDGVRPPNITCGNAANITADAFSKASLSKMHPQSLLS